MGEAVMHLVEDSVKPPEKKNTKTPSDQDDPLPVDVRSTLNELAKNEGLDIVVSNEILGKVYFDLGLDLGKVPFDQAFDAVVKAAGLCAERHGDLIIVYKAPKTTKTESSKSNNCSKTKKPANSKDDSDSSSKTGKDGSKSSTTSKDSSKSECIKEPCSGLLATRVYCLSHVKGKDIERLICPLLSPHGKVSSTPESDVGIGGFGPDTGSPAINLPYHKLDRIEAKAQLEAFDIAKRATGGNSFAQREMLVVRDYERVLQVIDDIVCKLDVPPPQVLIEATIFDLTLTDGMRLGVNHAVVDSAGRVLTVIGNGTLLSSGLGFPPLFNLITPNGVIQPGALSSGNPPSLFINPQRANDPLDRILVTKNNAEVDKHGLKQAISGDHILSFIKALSAHGNIKILASPSLLVLNKQPAKVLVGKRIAYRTQVVTSNGTSLEQVNFLDVGVQLSLRPFISEDGLIRMEIRPERSSDFFRTDDLPEITITSVTTNVMVPNGGMLIIGGLFEEKEVDLYDGVPLLDRIPVIRNLFGLQQRDTRVTELVVCIRPKIIHPGDAKFDEDATALDNWVSSKESSPNNDQEPSELSSNDQEPFELSSQSAKERQIRIPHFFSPLKFLGRRLPLKAKANLESAVLLSPKDSRKTGASSTLQIDE